jgi:hypothetical protein
MNSKRKQYGIIESIKVILFIKPIIQWYSLVFDLIFYLLIILITIDIVFLILSTDTKMSFMTTFFMSGAIDSVSPAKLFEMLNLKQFWNKLNQRIGQTLTGRSSLMKSRSLTKIQDLLIKISFIAEGAGRLFVLPLCLLVHVYTSASLDKFFTLLWNYFSFSFSKSSNKYTGR